ncbi:MAG: hypothetical protein ACOYOK_11070 [Pseudobdellovibrionaceae bacterium]
MAHIICAIYAPHLKWRIERLAQGDEAAKIMKMGGWNDLKTMMIYIRKAGIDIKGITDNFDLHNPSAFDRTAEVFELMKM